MTLRTILLHALGGVDFADADDLWLKAHEARDLWLKAKKDRDRAEAEAKAAREERDDAAQSAAAWKADVLGIVRLLGMTANESPIDAARRVVRERDEARRELEAAREGECVHAQAPRLLECPVDKPCLGCMVAGLETKVEMLTEALDEATSPIAIAEREAGRRAVARYRAQRRYANAPSWTEEEATAEDAMGAASRALDTAIVAMERAYAQKGESDG